MNEAITIVLLGSRGSGKTSVGRLVARRLGWEFVDVDDLIVARAGKLIREIFAQDGEPAFRDIEAGVLEDVMRWPGSRVVGLGGGTILRESNRELLKRSGAFRFYLNCDADTLFARISADKKSAETRPALTPLGGTLEEVKLLIERREPFYREVKTHELNASRRSPDDLADEIIKVIGNAQWRMPNAESEMPNEE